MWSQLSSPGGPPPPPPPPGGGFPPPPPPQQPEQYYESDNDSDEGGLGMTVNMVTSAASMLFSAARPLANANFAPPPEASAAPKFAPPPPQAEQSTAPKFAPPPAPIEQFASMLDEDEDMTEIDMNAETTTATSEAASLFDRPPTPTGPKPPLPPSGFAPPPPAAPAYSFQPPPQSPKPVFGRPPTPPVEAQEVFARPPTPTQTVFSQAPPTPTQNVFSQAPPTPTQNVFSQAPPTPTQNVFSQAPPTPTQNVFSQAPPTPTQNVFSQAPPTPTQNVFSQAPPTPTQNVFSQAPPTPTQNVFSQAPPTPNRPTAQNPFSMPPPTPTSANDVFAQPPTPTQNVFSQPPPTPSAAFMPPPAPPTDIQYPPPETPNPPSQQAVFAPPTPQENPFLQPPPESSTVSATPSVPTNGTGPPPQEDAFCQPPPTAEDSTVDSAPAPPVFENPPTVPTNPPPPQEDLFSQPPPTTEDSVALKPPTNSPPPQEDVFSQPPPTTEDSTVDSAPAPPVFENPPAMPTNPPPPQEDLFSQPPPASLDTAPAMEQQKPSVETKTLETIDNGISVETNSKGIQPLHRVTPPSSPGNLLEQKELHCANSGDSTTLTPLINNQSKSKAGDAAAAAAEATSASKKILLPPVASDSPPKSIQRKLRGPPPRSSIPARPARSRFKLPTPRKSRSRTPTRRTVVSSATRTPGTRTPLPTPGSKSRLFSSPRATPIEGKQSSNDSEEIATPAKSNVVPATAETVTEKPSNSTSSIPPEVQQEVPPANAAVTCTETKEVSKPMDVPVMPVVEKEVEKISPEETTIISPEATMSNSAISSPGMDDRMPEGWAETTDPNTQQIYYYNSITGETAWDRPTMPKATDVQTAELTAQEEVPATNDQPVREKEAIPPVEKEVSALPEGWEEVIDQSTQQTYFHNTITGETSWERPAKEVATEIEETSKEPEIAADENISEVEVPAEEPTQSSPVTADATADDNDLSDLAEGWVEAKDPSTQQIYYYNSASGETAWERPTKEEKTEEAKLDLTEEPEIAVEQNEKEESSPEDEPTIPVGEETATSTEPEQETPSLPEGWEETTDPSTEQVYFYNTITGETAWQRPTVPAASTLESEPEPESTAQFTNNDTTESPEKEIEPTEQADPVLEEEADALPDGWIEATDPVSGNLYYYQSATGTVSWDRPKPSTDSEQEGEEALDDEIDLEPEVAANESDSVEDKTPLPDGWIESFDPQTKNVYYYNSETGDVSWDRPGDAKDSDEGEEEADQKEDILEFDGEAEISNDDATPEIVAQSDDEKDPLPEGWIEDIDPKTEQVYYYNTFTGDVSWERPVCSSNSGESSEDESPENAYDASAEDAINGNDAAQEEEPELSNQNADGNDPLLGEWEEVNDTSTGQTYFYNPTTGETSWERPQAIDKSAEEESADTVEDAEVVTPDEEEEKDEPVGKTNSSSDVPTIDETLDSLMADFGIDESEKAEEETEEIVAESSGLEAESTIDDANTLPEGWVVEMDPTSGQNYYYNTITEETSWERPPPVEAESSTEIQNQDLTPEVEDDAGSIDNENKEAVETKDSSEAVEPENTQAMEHDDTAFSEGDGTEVSPLPENWERVDDPDNGTYYYNALTGDTSWDRPVDEVEKEKGEVETSTVDEVLEGDKSVSDVHDSVDIDENGAHNDWVESNDPSTGNVYYYNTKTGETSWENPGSSVESEVPDENTSEDEVGHSIPPISKAIEPTDTHVVESTSINESGESECPAAFALPDGWSTVLDSTTGEVAYYQNNLTNAITFTRPVTAEETADDASTEDQTPSLTDETEEKETEDVLPDGWTEIEDSSSGQMYYYNSLTGESSWDKPTVDGSSNEEVGGDNVDNEENEATACEDGDSIEPESTIDETKTEGTDLPENWIESTDSSSGKKYYFNLITEEVSWEPPQIDIDASIATEAEELSNAYEEEGAISNETTEEAIISDANEDEDPRVDSQTKDDLPEGWEEVTDPSSGEVYYYNADSGETSWERPTGEDTAVEEEAEAQKAEEEHVALSENIDETENSVGGDDPANIHEDAVEDLPYGWEEVTDPSSGEVYYYNADSGETSWERPTGEDTAVKEVQNELDIQPDIVEEAENVGDNCVNSDGDITEELPEGWEEVTDPSSGEVYYYSAETDETSWERPTGKAPAAEDEAEVKQDIQPDIVEEAENDLDVTNDLPAGWEEVEDPSSGQVYYYNAETDETSWERPMKEENPNTILPTYAEGCDDGANYDISNVGTDEGEDETENMTDDLPAGWEVVEDTSTGDIYYFHAESGETSWERPTSEEREEDVPDEMAHGGDDDGDENIEDNLPVGWEELEDPSSGEIYFYHAESGETSWERPVARKAEVEDPAGEDEGILSENVQNHETSEKPAIEAEVDEDNIELPDGWEEVEDPSSGQIYFYHAESGETSWERPVVDENQDIRVELEQPENSAAEEEIPQYDDKDAVDDAIDNEQAEGELPYGWEEVEDSSSGQIYYYNAESGETSWEKPTTESPKDIDNVDEVDEPTQTRSNNSEAAGENVDRNDEDDGDDLGALPEGWTEMEDPTSGDVYYYNTESGETSWERPTMGEMEADTTSSPLEPETVVNDSQKDDGDSFREPLPQGWVESEDSSSGEIYYYHSESGEVSWERPTKGLADAIGRETSEEITFEPKPADDDGELQEGWVESVDPDSGEVYYYHSESGDVSWTKPTNNEVVETKAAHVQGGESPVEFENVDELPDGWIESKDPTSGDVYYYHSESGETRWERPAANDNKLSELSIVEEEDETNQFESSEVETTEDSPVPGPLPEFWVESTDPSTGEIYYFNSLTQETSWERPNGDESSKISELEGDEVDRGGNVNLEGDDPEGDSEPTAAETLPLPEDWIESIDPTSGQIYYYNVKTEQTSWERPSESSTDDSKATPMPKDQPEIRGEQNERIVEKDEPGDNDLSVQSIENEATESDISGDWIEVEDPSGGEPYYYNSKTGETRWEKPSTVEVNNPHIDGMIQDQATDHSIDDGDLVDGWVEVVDPDSGDCYWYNNETQETTWDKPSKPAATHDERAFRDERKNVIVPDEDEMDGDNNIRDDWVDVQDDIPGNETFAPLPQGWIESTDPSTGDAYYYNEITNETSWERPEQEDSPSGVSNVANAVDDKTSQALKSASSQFSIISDIEIERKKFNVTGPFTLCDDSVVTDYIMSKAQSKDILWQLIAIAVQSKGRLRSDYGAVDKSSPEAAIVKLLLSSPDYVNHTKKSKNDIIIEEKFDDEKERQDSIVKVQDLLIRGEREYAIEEAILIGDFATALLVASMCDPDTYKRVARKYAESKFRSDSPMFTTTMLFSGKVEAPSRRNSGNWGVAPEEIRKNWKSHLASIINNRTFGWDKIVLSLGDRLAEVGCVEEAHFCYMVCGYPITSPTDAETRAALLGCDHSKPNNRTLLTEESLAAFERTEAYEWAKRLGNQHAYFAKFQPFKLMYAMLLADVGEITQAQKFVQSIQISLDASRTVSSEIQEVSIDQLFNNDVAFELAYNEIEQQLGEGNLKSKYSESLLVGGFMQITAVNPKSVPRRSNREQPDSWGKQQRFEPMNFEDKNPALDATFMTAKSNLMDVSGYTVDEKKTSMPQSSNVTAKKSFVTSPQAKPESTSVDSPIAPELMKQARHGKKPIMVSDDAEQREKPMAANQPPKKQERPKPAPVTAPAVMTGKKEEKAKPRTPAPASSGKPKPAPGSGAFGGMKSWIIKKLNPDAKECHLPENEEQPYYDKDLKRWIFPGDDPAEVGKPLAPPPMVMKKDEPAADTPKEDTKPKDAVSTLMAPPPSRLSAKKRIPGAMGSPMMGMMMPPGGGPPGMMTPTALGGATTPKFATFTPKAAVFTPKPADTAPEPASKEGQEEPTN